MTLKNKCCLYVIIPIRLFPITICNLLTFPRIIDFMMVDIKVPNVEIVVAMVTTQGIANAGISHSCYDNHQSCLRLS